jgi:hypothetical protein
MVDMPPGESSEISPLDDRPYGGLFGEGVLPSIVQELMADPWSDFQPQDVVESSGKSPPAVRAALRLLAVIGLVKNVGKSETRPIYRVDTESNRFRALTWLAYSWSDDRDGTEIMDHSVADYALTDLRHLIPVSVQALLVNIQFAGGASPQVISVAGESGSTPSTLGAISKYRSSWNDWDTRQPAGKTQLQLDLASLYKIDPAQTVLEMVGTHHANHVMVQLLQRDIYLDFLAIPGIIRDGKHSVQAFRIQLSHQTAYQLMTALQQMMSQARSGDIIERFPPDSKEPPDPDRKW